MVAQFMQPFSGFDSLQPPSAARIHEAAVKKKVVRRSGQAK
jgi:hypothetical protein